MAELTNFEKIRRLPWQLGYFAANGVFCTTTFFGSVFILFLDELGFDKSRIGILLSLFPFCGLTALFTAPYIARFGFKRTFITFIALRLLFVALLLFLPVYLRHFGIDGTFYIVAVVILLFAFCRAIAETAFYPWAQETIPDFIRGKFGAMARQNAKSSITTATM